MRVVLDTNVALSGVFWGGPPRRLLDLWLEGALTLLVSLPILDEYRAVFRRFTPATSEIYAHWDHLFTTAGELVTPLPLASSVRDPKDHIFLEATIGGKAHCLVTGDKDLLVLNDVRGIPILSPRAFLQRF
jgi:putative PIN family toxin of toxin-antitoxin system